MINGIDSQVISTTEAPSSALSVELEEGENHNDHTRAALNVAEWRKFLPADCVEAMIKDGWHFRV